MIYSVESSRKAIAIEGSSILQVESDTFFGNGKSIKLKLESPTWEELFVFAKAAMLYVNDKHHCFFEGVEFNRTENGIKIYDLVVGS